MKVKTPELTGAVLDLAVAKALGRVIRSKQSNGTDKTGFYAAGSAYDYFWKEAQQERPVESYYWWCPSESWKNGGCLVEQFKIYLSPPHVVFATRLVNGERISADKVYDGWTAKVDGRIARKPSLISDLPGLCGLYTGEGPTPLIAICRAVVACRLGEEVEVPDELVQSCAT